MLPEHVAIVLDGNGRWAARRGLPRIEGHRAGAERLREIVVTACEIGLSNLTVFAFSTENWKRGEQEVGPMIELFRSYMINERQFLDKHDVRIQFIGERDRLSSGILRQMQELEKTTLNNKTLHLVIALNYGGRQEIVSMAKRVAELVDSGQMAPEQISETVMSGFSYTCGIPDPDLIIRTSGELRFSNFLLWQSAYSEFMFVEACWPDFTPEHFRSALQDFKHRKRRFGGL